MAAPTLTLAVQEAAIIQFFSESLAVLTSKSRDYAPEGVPLLNVLDSCRKWGLQPLQVLGIAYQKQETALSRYVRGEPLDTDSPRSRLIDAVNYLALMAFYIQFRDRIHEQWEMWLNRQPCLCTYGSDKCTRCARLEWVKACRPAQ